MGTTFQSLAVPTPDFEGVKKLLLRWLSAKGFDPRPDKPLFGCDENTERGLCLFSNDQWVIILYSNMLHEGERLLFELGKLDKPVLQVWAFDSDIWGYDLHVGDELSTSFNSNPSYFGRFVEMPSSSDGDPALLCRLLPIEVNEEDIAKIQRGRALFKEWVCRRFCEALGIAPAGVGFREIEEISLNPGTRKVGEYRMDEIYFVSRVHDPGDEKISLHALPVTMIETGDTAQISQHDLPANLRALVLIFRMVSWIVWPMMYFLTLLFRFYIQVQRISFIRKSLAKQGPIRENGFITDLYQLQVPTSRIEGRSLINDRNHWRITLPEGTEGQIGNGLQWLRIEGLEIMVRSLRPNQLRDNLRLGVGMSLLEDTKFFVGEFPARSLIFMTPQHGRKDAYHYLHYIQGPKAIYQFSFLSLERIPGETAAHIRATIDSFELT